jgi:hypothetical protein
MSPFSTFLQTDQTEWASQSEKQLLKNGKPVGYGTSCQNVACESLEDGPFSRGLYQPSGQPVCSSHWQSQGHTIEDFFNSATLPADAAFTRQ